MNFTIDAMGKACPIPVVEAKRAIDSMEETGTVAVHVDNDAAVENLKRLAVQSGRLKAVDRLADSHYVVTIAVSPEGKEDDFEREENTIAVFDKAVMGEGSEELGKLLIKGFIYALRELPRLPKACIFYNGGAWLTAEGSESLEDLQAMEEDGVEILTCGTCAKFFGLEDKLKVGSLTNMYTIAEMMSRAERVIRP